MRLKLNLIDMLKIILLATGMSVASLSLGQTVAIEEAYLNASISSGRWTQEEASARGKKWAKFKAQYPVLPYDAETGRFEVKELISFPGVSRGTAFKRAKEWAALRFGKLSEVTEYEDAETGKLIFEGYMEITHMAMKPTMWGKLRAAPSSSRLHFSLIVTIKDGKAMVEFENLRFRYWIPPSTIGIYVPGEWQSYGIGGYFPIVSKDVEGWEIVGDMVKSVFTELKWVAPSLESHIKKAAEDNGF